MNLTEFIKKYNGKKIDFDNSYGAQCVDIIKAWVTNLGLPMTYGNGNQYARNADGKNYKWIANTPSGIPKAGDIMVWGKDIGPYGHVAIYMNGNVNSFESFDQNYPLGSACHVQAHNYRGVEGWLHMPVLDNKPVPKPAPIDPHLAEIAKLKDLLRKANSKILELENASPVVVEKTVIKEIPVEVIKEVSVTIIKEVEKPYTMDGAWAFIINKITNLWRKKND